MNTTMRKPRLRPDPVSCESCRSKKLRCTKTQPCTNCLARGITCKFLVPPQQQQRQHTASTPDLAPLFSRIEQLEDVVASLQKKQQDDEVEQAQRSRMRLRSVDIDTPRSLPLEDQDARFLENVGTRDESLLCDLSDLLVYQTQSVREILSLAGLSQDRRRSSIILLPEYQTARLLLQNYEAIVALCPVVHIPSARSAMNTFYIRLDEANQVNPSQAALFLSLFSLSAFFFEPSIASPVVVTDAETFQLSKIFAKSALDVLEQLRRSGCGSLEEIQAYIVMSLAISHIDGFSARTRALLSTATCIAQDLRLHRLDDDEAPKPHSTDSRTAIDLEMKRRVFWYIASEDWLQSTISGPQEGTYWIQINQIRVNLPRDCNDDDLVAAASSNNSRAAQPTIMTIFLERVRLSHICREITDTMPLSTQEVFRLPYDQVIALDQKLQNFLATLPHFFQTDPTMGRTNRSLEQMYPQLPLWHNCIYKAVLSRRCKLNQKFLLRQSTDPRYAYSRRVCVELSRTVISGCSSLATSGTPGKLATRTGVAVHFTLLALAVLVTDLCFNKGEADAGQIKEDVAAAFAIIEDARGVSALPEQSLASLRAVLQKHGVELMGTRAKDASQRAEGVLEHTASSGEASIYQFQSDYLGGTVDSLSNTYWQTALESEGCINFNAWDALFSNLDNQPI